MSALRRTNQKLAKQLDVKYIAGYNLRTRRADKIDIATRLKSLVLLVNEKGSICHATHPNGTFIVMKSPKHFHNCFHPEYAVSYFINTLKEVVV